MNLATLIFLNAKNQGAKTAIIYGEQTLSYQQLWQGIEGIAATLFESGIRPGDRVGLAMKDHPVHVMSHFSVARLGAVIVPVDHRWSDAEKKAAFKAFNLKAVITDGESIPDVKTLTLGDDNAAPENLPPIDDHLSSHPLLISLSSGTTGKPKGALVTHEQFYQRFVSQWAAIGIDSNDCFAVVTPLFFGAGRSFALCLLVAGGQIHLSKPGQKPEALYDTLQQSEITSTFLPPTLLRRLLTLDQRDTPFFPHLNFLLVSGEPLHSDEAQICLKTICPNLVGYYASSEGGGISVLKSQDFVHYSHTVGLPTFRTEVEIVNDNDDPVDTNQVGRLRYRGPGVATRFVDSDGTEKDSSRDGWFYPGDLGEKLDTGHLVLRGRDKDVIIRGGVNVYPAEIESVLVKCDQINEIAVIGKLEADRGEQVIAYFSGDADEAAVTAFAKDNLAPYKVPSVVHRLDQLPKAASGKIDKKKLADL